MPETPEKIFYDFIQLDENDRTWVLEQLASRSDGDPIDMFVASAAVLSADQFEEAKKRLKDRGYIPVANPEKVEFGQE